jgi:hypothetical protein
MCERTGRRVIYANSHGYEQQVLCDLDDGHEGDHFDPSFFWAWNDAEPEVKSPAQRAVSTSACATAFSYPFRRAA